MSEHPDPAEGGQQEPPESAAPMPPYPGGPVPHPGASPYWPYAGYGWPPAQPGNPQRPPYPIGTPQPGYGPPPGGMPPVLPPRGGRHLPPHLQVQRSNGSGGVGAGVFVALGAIALVIGLIGGLVGGLAILNGTEPDRVEAGPITDSNEKSPPFPEGGEIEGVAAKTLPSVVQILARGDSAQATGSGFVADEDLHIITNNHVIAGAAEEGEIMVVFNDEKQFRADIVGRSPAYDIAVLELEQAAENYAPVPLAESPMRVGETVVAFGAPLGLSSSVTTGIVSATDRPVTVGGGDDASSYINAIQTDAAINPGNSGGPLVNLRGEVVGVNSAIATLGFGGQSGNIGVGFAIPIEQALRTANQLVDEGEASYPIVGASVNTRPTLDGARIVDVTPAGPADDAGLLEGDIVIELDGQKITDGIDLIVAIRSHEPGDRISLEYLREGNIETTEVTLDEQIG